MLPSPTSRLIRKLQWLEKEEWKSRLLLSAVLTGCWTFTVLAEPRWCPIVAERYVRESLRVMLACRFKTGLRGALVLQGNFRR